MKKLIPALIIALCMIVVMPSCKKKVADADVKAKVEAAVAAIPGVAVDVKDGVATLTGEVADDAAKAQVETALAALTADAKSGLKSVVNSLTVAPPKVEVTPDQALENSIKDAIKDFPTVQVAVKDGVVTVTGDLAKDKLKTLKQILDGLHPKKVVMTGVKIK